MSSVYFLESAVIQQKKKSYALFERRDKEIESIAATLCKLSNKHEPWYWAYLQTESHREIS